MDSQLPTNYLPHNVNVYLDDGTIISIPAEFGSDPVRLDSVEQKNIDLIGNIPVVTPQTFTGIIGTPMQHNPAGIIVSAIVADYMVKKGMTQYGPIYTPSTGKYAVRKDGVIAGTKALELWNHTSIKKRPWELDFRPLGAFDTTCIVLAITFGALLGYYNR